MADEQRASIGGPLETVLAVLAAIKLTQFWLRRTFTPTPLQPWMSPRFQVQGVTTPLPVATPVPPPQAIPVVRQPITAIPHAEPVPSAIPHAQFVPNAVAPAPATGLQRPGSGGSSVSLPPITAAPLARPTQLIPAAPRTQLPVAVPAPAPSGLEDFGSALVGPTARPRTPVATPVPAPLEVLIRPFSAAVQSVSLVIEARQAQNDLTRAQLADAQAALALASARLNQSVAARAAQPPPGIALYRVVKIDTFQGPLKPSLSATEPAGPPLPSPNWKAVPPPKPPTSFVPPLPLPPRPAFQQQGGGAPRQPAGSIIR